MTKGSEALVFDIQRFSVFDGPGIRTTVFLKGCPLRCAWCHNPEAFCAAPQLRFTEQFCHDCGACAQACPHGHGKGDPAGGVCTLCGACAEACPFDALQVSGRRYSVAQIVSIVLRDKAFYDSSGGGVTFSGGEPTQQCAFLMEALTALRAQAVHTAIDTCGYCPEAAFAALAQNADLVLFDLKHMDEAQHERYTGVSNRLILANLSALLKSGKEVTIRFPMIPGVNDGDENLAAMADFLIERGLRQVEVSPYHTYGEVKYRQLRLPAPPRFVPASEQAVAGRLAFMRARGLDPVII